jgi:hypothetical protein
MDIESAPSVEDDDSECGLCGREGTFVLYDGDRLCKHCGYAPTSNNTMDTTEDSEWEGWLTHRNSEYSGFFGPDRVKFVGGFASAYEFESDF